MGNYCCCSPTQQDSQISNSQRSSEVQETVQQFQNVGLVDEKVQSNVSYDQQSGNTHGDSVSIQSNALSIVTVPPTATKVVSSHRNPSIESKIVTSLSLEDGQAQRNINYDRQSRSSISSQSNALSTITVSPSTTQVIKSRSNPFETKIVNRGDMNPLMNFIRDYTITLNWESRRYRDCHVHFIELDRYSFEYEEVEQYFNKTNKRCFQITRIERIQNPYLLAAFLLKEEEMTRRIGYIDIQELFHGTKKESVMGICSDNFDWKRYGENVGSKFGRGICFTSISNYATHYADDTYNNRIMLLVHVLVGNEIVGTANMKLPPGGYDTTIKPDGHVTVKYEDNEFYPAYKITYKCTNRMELQNRQLRKGNNRRGQARQQRVRRAHYNHYDYD